MANANAANLPAGVDRTLAAEAARYPFNPLEVAQRPGLTANGVEAVINAYRDGLQPLNMRYPALRHHGGSMAEALASTECQELAEALKMIGRKVRPDFSPDQAMNWVGALVLALSDLAASTAIKATREALHEPVEFLASVEQIIRKKADVITERHRRALRNLRELQDAIERGLKPPVPQIDDKRGEPMTQADVDRLAAAPADSLNATIFRMGLGCGAIVELEDGRYVPADAVQGDLL
jgi:hypothetical protein